MRELVIGDVHGCSAELVELIHTVEPDRVTFVGDLFTKGPDPLGVWRCIRSLGARSVLGNHDRRLLRVDPTDQEARQCVHAIGSDAIRWLRSCPLFLSVGGFSVVHAGLHPRWGRFGTTPQMALNMRRFSDQQGSLRPWTEHYCTEERVIFGHDARVGLFRRERYHQPWLIGLDSGCVYGGALSGYLVNQDEIVQVSAKKVYRSI